MTKIILITYYYPPIIGGGVQRIRNFVKGINKECFKPIIVTVKHSEKHHDEENVIRVKNIGMNFDSRIVTDKRCHQDNYSNGFIKSISKYLKKIIKRVLIPDAKIFWAIAVALRMLKLDISKEDIIVTSSPPNSTHISGLLIKLFKEVTWIIDLRDAWTIDPLDESINNRSLRMWIDRFIERYVIKCCDKVIVNTEYSCKLYRDKYQVIDKFITINNSFEIETFSRLQIYNSKKDTNKSIVLSHFGALSKSHYQRKICNFISAIEDLELLINDMDITIKFYGDLTEEEICRIKDYEGVLKLEYFGQVEYEMAIKEMFQSDALILIDRELSSKMQSASNIPGKLYDYIGCGKPIIAIVPDGACKELLFNIGVKKFAFPNNIYEIRDLLYEFIKSYRQKDISSFVPLKDEAYKYSSENMVKKFMYIIKKNDKVV